MIIFVLFQYTESQLYKQLCFYEYIFDFAKACHKNKDERKCFLVNNFMQITYIFPIFRSRK